MEDRFTGLIQSANTASINQLKRSAVLRADATITTHSKSYLDHRHGFGRAA